MRSQDSWHDGAGFKFQENRQGESSLPVAVSNNFWASSGIDPWTKGELKLLRNLKQSAATFPQASCLSEADGTPRRGKSSHGRADPAGRQEPRGGRASDRQSLVLGIRAG